ncbi:Uncharacterised protein [Mycobacteroides abscessus subsp. abscessus]|nr:Uncharacterised protein [Mycobacteroides abscessus subsp. abscessus]SIC80343.1 Uncharacterised protein [Mycobacteroides abscessus subsp. abscessus]SKP26142.1 Uncharacterised protein [Mycobacteroides abscessus subsp. abscessus]
MNSMGVNMMRDDSSVGTYAVAGVVGDVDRHPLAVVSHVLTSFAITLCAVAVGLIFVGSFLHNAPPFIAGVLTMLAGITLELRSKYLASRATIAVSRLNATDQEATRGA